MNDNILKLGFKLSGHLTPSLHVDIINCKSLKVLGFMLRLFREIELQISLKTLYCTLVHPILEYGAIIRSPHASDDIKLIRKNSTTVSSYC